MPASFSTLPTELMDGILCHCSRDDLAKIRYASQRFRDVASQHLFRTLTLLPSPQSAKNVASIISSKDLRSYVRDFYFLAQTSLESLDLSATYLDESEDLQAQALDSVRLISRLDTLVVLRCHHDLGPSVTGNNDDSVADFDKFRGEIVKTLVVGPADRPPKWHAALKKLETLDIGNLPCRPQPDLTDQLSFSTLFQTLQTLVLRFDYNWANDRPYGDSQRGKESQEFFTNLPKAWLAPASDHLTCLTLGASQLWGYVLKVDFRGVHFPRLQSLVMEKFVFCHNWQLNWITSHTSLQELCLFQCWILLDATWSGGKDDEGYPTTLLEYGDTALVQYRYSRSWDQYYDSFSKNLGSLRWFTTKPVERVKTDLVGLYTRFDNYRWSPLAPRADVREKDEKKIKQLMAKANGRMREHLKATTKERMRKHLEATTKHRSGN